MPRTHVALIKKADYIAGYCNKLVCAGLGFFVLASILFAAPADAAGTGLIGAWARDDGATRMVIAPCGNAICATNSWVKDPKGKERVGDRLVLNLKPVSSSIFEGEAYDVRRRMSYKITITLQATTMHTTGCVFLGLVCKTAGWTKTD